MSGGAYIAAAWRTPFVRAGGALAAVSAQVLATETVRPALQIVRALPGLADILLGNVLNGRGNLGRYAGLAAGFGHAVPGATIDRQCASGMEAVAQATMRCERSFSPVTVIAGGVESMSTAPYLMARPARAFDRRPPEFLDIPLSPPSIGDPSMIETAETVSRECQVSRAEMDAFALQSHKRAISALAGSGARAAIIPFEAGLSEPLVQDVGPRPDTALERLARLPPVLQGGTVTAGNASGISDGGAAVIVMNEAALLAADARPLARILDSALSGIEPARMGLGPVAAVRQLLKQHGLSARDIAHWEINEAFAGQVLAVAKQLGLDPAAINPQGGAIALGHPLGASGARLVGDVACRLASSAPGTKGIAALCVGGGMGMAILLEHAG